MDCARACELAGVEPKFQKINGQDQKAYILSVNINRRHKTAAQRAMATAMIYPTPNVRGKKSLAPKDFSAARLSQTGFGLWRIRPIGIGRIGLFRNDRHATSNAHHYCDGESSVTRRALPLKG
jgi:hypothetical protein